MPEVLSRTPTDTLVALYRGLKANADSLAEDMSELRTAIQERVKVEPYQDEQGYAKMLFREASTSYPPKEITRVRDVWLNSDVPEIRTCGEMLQSLGKVKPSANYLQIR